MLFSSRKKLHLCCPHKSERTSINESYKQSKICSTQSPLTNNYLRKITSGLHTHHDHLTQF